MIIIIIYIYIYYYDNPFSTAFLANNPAAIILSGFDVLVHEVIAAITTLPWLREYYLPSKLNYTVSFYFSYGIPNPLKPILLFKQDYQSFFISERETLSCGLFGPDKLGYTEARSKSMISPEKLGSLP